MVEWPASTKVLPLCTTTIRQIDEKSIQITHVGKHTAVVYVPSKSELKEFYETSLNIHPIEIKTMNIDPGQAKSILFISISNFKFYHTVV